jgi:hypothetical protein
MIHYANRIVQLMYLVLALGTSPAYAQVTYPDASSYQHPYQPRLSPYLDLLRNDNSLLTPYHAFVQPRREFQQRQLQLSTDLNRLEQTQQRQLSPKAWGRTRLPTGNGGRFQTYLHFYSVNPSVPRSRF